MQRPNQQLVKFLMQHNLTLALAESITCGLATHQLSAATAAFGAGLARTTAGTYLPAFYLAGGACLVASLLVLAARPRSGKLVLAMRGVAT